MSEVTRRHIALVLAVAAIIIVWDGLYAPSQTGALFLIAVIAALPSVVGPYLATRWMSAGLMLASLVGVTAIAVRQPPWGFLFPGSEAYTGLRRLLQDGVAEANQVIAPISWDAAPAFGGILDLGLALLVASAASAIVVGRRPAVAIASLSAGAAYRWTVAPTASPILDGVLLLAVFVCLLALVREPTPGGLSARHPRGAIVSGTVAMAVGALVAMNVTAGERWWDWQGWRLNTGRDAGITSLTLAQNYGQLDWPDTPRQIMRVRTPRPLPLAAAPLSRFDGASFVPQSDVSQAYDMSLAGSSIETGAQVASPQGPYTQQIHLQHTRSNMVYAGGRITQLEGQFPGRVELRGEGNMVASPGIGPDFTYTVSVTMPDPDPAVLRQATSYDPAMTPRTQTMVAGWGQAPSQVIVPLWPQGRTAAIPEYRIGDYTRVRRLAREVIGDASSPYVAVNRIESHLRSNYAYDEKPPPVTGMSPINAFLFETRLGFCQHYAGAMALMLRLVGIPARVVVGYAPGRFEPRSEEWVVVDRDAHSWVQVYLPDAGWVDFDPTPGRYAPNRVSVGSPNYTPPASTGNRADDIAQAPVKVPDWAQPIAPTPSSDTPAATPTATEDDPGDVPVRWWWVLVLAVVAGATAFIAPVRRGWMRLRDRSRGDDRAQVLAATRSFEDEAARLGMLPPRNLDGTGRAKHLEDTFGVDARELYDLAQDARYRPGIEPEAVPAAWSHERRLRRQIRPMVPRRRRVQAWFGISPGKYPGAERRAHRQGPRRRRRQPRSRR